jgi:hypothetical protein
MNPALRSPDVLQIVPYSDDRKIQRGDVIVFVPPGRSISVTHRVPGVDNWHIRRPFRLFVHESMLNPGAAKPQTKRV